MPEQNKKIKPNFQGEKNADEENEESEKAR